MVEIASPSPRRRSAPMPVGSRLQVLLAAAVCLLPLLLQLPSALASGLGLGAILVSAASWRRPLPFLLRLLIGIAMVVAIATVARGVGRDTACMVLAAMLALKPSETFSLRDGRSLLGFALFAPFATFLLDQGPASLALALLGLLAALHALQRLAADEAETQADDTAPWRSAAGSVLKLVGLGLPLALAAFWLFPRMATPLWGLPDRAVARPGLSDSMTPGGWLDLMNDDTPTARVQFLGTEPAQRELYWRGPVLMDFDGRTWHQAGWLRRLPQVAFQPRGTGWEYQIELEATDKRQLVALDLPTRVPDGAYIGGDFGTWADEPLNNVTRWRMHSAAPIAVEPTLPVALRQRALDLPDGFNPQTVALGRQWRLEAGNDDAAIANRALDWVRREFAYTLDVPIAGRNEVDDFLFRRKQGYCEHFSSAFVVLMRAAGIPARVVTGYAGGYRNDMGGYWLIRRSDAHAWAEIWLPRRGWVRVDPTAAVAPERVFDTVADRQPGRIGNFSGFVPAYNAGDWLRRGWNDLVLGFDAERQGRMLNPFGSGAIGTQGLIVLFSISVALALAWMAWLIARGEREKDPLLRAWRRLGQRYARRGAGRGMHEPAQAWAERVGADVPTAGEHLHALSRRFSDARYAGIAPEALRRLLRDLAAHRP